VKGRVWAPLGSVVAAIASSACCWLPLSAAALGLGMGGAAALLDRFRLPLIVVTIGFLGLGYYLNYRPQRECAPDDPCAVPDARWRRASRIMLWVSTGVVLFFVAFPWVQPYLPAAAGGEAELNSRGADQVVALSRDAHELREAFNRDRGSTRLVALLSPT